MIYRCRRRKRKFSWLRKLLLRSAIVIIALTVGFVVLCESKIEEFKPDFIRTQSELMSSTVINDAVYSALEELNYSYDDIAVINYSNSGNIKSIQTNTIKLDKIKLAVTKSAQQEIAKIYDCEVDIPLGAFTDITILSNVGPKLNVNMCITGSFNSEIVSTFEHAGLNQTVHHIKLILTSKIITTSLDYSGSITYTTDYEIAQTVIVGDIPSSYGSLYQVQ